MKATREMIQTANSLPRRFRLPAMQRMERAFVDAYQNAKEHGDFWDAEDEHASCTLLASAYACDEALRFYSHRS